MGSNVFRSEKWLCTSIGLPDPSLICGTNEDKLLSLYVQSILICPVGIIIYLSHRDFVMIKWGGEGDDRGWDGWMASLTRWTWVWVNSRRWWWTGTPGMLRFMGWQRVRHDWATELNWTGSNLTIWMLPELAVDFQFQLLVDSLLAPDSWLCNWPFIFQSYVKNR